MKKPSADPSFMTRRRFLGQASCAAVSSIPVLNTLLNLRLAERLAAVTAPAAGEYRALVCLFLAGGNDSFNMLVPRDPPAYATYQARAPTSRCTPAQLIDINPVGLPELWRAFRDAGSGDAVSSRPCRVRRQRRHAHRAGAEPHAGRAELQAASRSASTRTPTRSSNGRPASRSRAAASAGADAWPIC